jgi:hypothetical protein
MILPLNLSNGFSFLKIERPDFSKKIESYPFFIAFDEK